MATSTIPNPNLSFDTTPTSGSSKPVTSNGIYNAIQQSTATRFGGNSAVSFDDLTTAGMFGVTISTTGNRPVSNTGSYAVIVISGGLSSTGNAVTQIAIPTGSNTPNAVFIRNKNAAGTWSSWYKISATLVS